MMVWCLGVLPMIPLVGLAGLTLGNEVHSWINKVSFGDFGSVSGWNYPGDLASMCVGIICFLYLCLMCFFL